MPKDGTVHELANHTIIFLEQLLEYAETAGAMLLMHVLLKEKSREKSQGSKSALVNSENCRKKIADYMSRVLSALGLNLSNKSETYSDPALRPMFMINNFNYIVKSLERSGLLKFLMSWNKDIFNFYKEQILEQKRMYSESWSKVLHFIMEVDKPLSQQRVVGQDKEGSGVKLKDKDRQNIKDKFTGFNKELEELYRVQKTYAMPDTE